MSIAKVRYNAEVDTYDVVFLGLSKMEAMALRELPSAIEFNRNWAQDNKGSIIDAVRGNSVLAELHQEFKDTIRDVKPVVPSPLADEEEYVSEEEDPFWDFQD